MVVSCCSLFSSAAVDKTVRVGIFSLGKFQGWDENGDPTGYNVDYLNKIAEKNHWTYDYVDCENWVNATEMLKNGDIDLLAPAQITDALKEQFDYSTLYMGMNHRSSH